MDFPIVVIVIVILLLLSVLIWLTQIKLPAHQAMIYAQRLAAEADYDSRLLASAKILTFQGVGYLTLGVDRDGKILYQPILVTTETTAGRTIYDADKVQAHNDAVQLVSDTIASTDGKGKKLLTADEWQARGHARDDWQAAVDWLKAIGLTRTHVGGSNPGTFTTKRDLNDCMLALAVHGLPPYPSTIEQPAAARKENVET